jgi:hypothetical protein
MKIPKTEYPTIFRRHVEDKQSLKVIALDYNCSAARISQIVASVRAEREADEFFKVS